MARRTTLIKAIFSVLCFTPLASPQVYTFELTKKYFTDVSMICDHPDLNITQDQDIRSIAWILPDGSAVDATRKPNPTLFRLSGPNKLLDAYNLTALNINDPVFGYYICIVVYKSETKPFSVVKWGLNVDGADFTELMRTYEENAIVGGISAAAMLVVIGAFCLFWHFRYSNRHQKVTVFLEGRSTDDDIIIHGPRRDYYNKSFVTDNEMMEVHLKNEADGHSDIVKDRSVVKL